MKHIMLKRCHGGLLADYFDGSKRMICSEFVWSKINCSPDYIWLTVSKKRPKNFAKFTKAQRRVVGFCVGANRQHHVAYPSLLDYITQCGIGYRAEGTFWFKIMEAK